MADTFALVLDDLELTLVNGSKTLTLMDYEEVDNLTITPGLIYVDVPGPALPPVPPTTGQIWPRGG